jgi:hypothetical protein
LRTATRKSFASSSCPTLQRTVPANLAGKLHAQGTTPEAATALTIADGTKARRKTKLHRPACKRNKWLGDAR